MICLSLTAAQQSLRAQERFYRLFDDEEGLNPTAVRALAQDPTGFLWIGTEGGLFRYDGVEMRRWSPELLDRTIPAVVASPTGLVIAMREGGVLFEVTSESAVPVRGPAGLPIESARDVAFDTNGQLWVVQGEELWRRDREDRWSVIDLPLAAGERPLRVRPDRGSGVLVATTRSAWRVRPPASERLLDFHDIVDLYATSDGRVLVLGFLGELFEVTSAGSREVPHSTGLRLGRAISVTVRGTTVWIALDRYLIAWRGGQPTEVLGPESGIQSGGPLLVDHEGSLWLGSFIGLYQFPEPETRIWTERSGLPSNHSRFLSRTGNTVWVTTWQGAGYVREEEEGSNAATVKEWFSQGRIYVDSRGVLWAGTNQGIVEVDERRIVRRHGSEPVGLYGFLETPDGEIWLGTSRGLLRRDPTVGVLRSIALPPFGDEPPSGEMLLLDRYGDLWISSGEAVCRAPAAELAAERAVEWRCERIPGAVHLTGLVEMPSGAIWASTNRLGVLRRHQGSWTPLPDHQDLPSRAILSLVPARSEGLWIVGHGVLHRVTETPEARAGWRVLEQLAHWHGLPVVSGTHLLEDIDGGIWVTTSRGVAHVTAEARFTAQGPPRVALVDAWVDDERIPLASGLELPHDRNRLELRFAALSFRDPALVRYQVRLSEDKPWVATSGEASFRWVDLTPGEYRAQVRASLDGETWSEAPAAYAFRVAPPWYRQPWAIALYTAAVALILYAAYRLRVAYLLRLERQRTRIAMDLHDDIGSGLGSIGILSGILATDGIADPERSEMARQIAGTAQELSYALSHIVWALDPRARTLEELAARLAEHGRRLFAHDATKFTTRFPTAWPPVRTAPLVRRNVLLIGLEALHNAARHADARNVELALAPRPDGAWELTIADDGVGLPRDLERESEAGMGLRSTRRRSAEIGAEIRWSARRGLGTTVCLAFRPRGTGWRSGRFLERRTGG